MLKISARFVIIILVLSALTIFTISAGGCPKKNKNTKVGSSNNAFTINAPSNLVATSLSPLQINLSWQDNSNNEDGFEIYRSTDGVNYILLAAINSNMISYSDTGPFSALIVYYYRIRAFNIIGDRSAYSNEANTTVFSPLQLMSVTAGVNHTIAIANNGTIWGWGINDYFQLGLGNAAPVTVTIPALIGMDSDWSVIAPAGGDYDGGLFTVALKVNGTIWAWGDNTYAQLGLGDSGSGTERFIPIQIDSNSDWSKIAIGSAHTLACKTNGTLWSWGWNPAGQLGLGDRLIDRLTPTQIGVASNWMVVNTANLPTISAGAIHSIGLKTNRTIWSWGGNDYRQLGRSLIGGYGPTPDQIGTQSDWAGVVAGDYHTLAFKTNRTLWAWGYNAYGQAGLGYNGGNQSTPSQVTIDSDWSIVSAEQLHTIALKTNGTLWAWGFNSGYNNDEFANVLGLGDAIDRNTPSQIGSDSDWIDVTAGSRHTLAQKSNGTTWAWGRNEGGQLGFGDTLSRIIPYPLGSPTPPSSLTAIVVSSSQFNIAWIDNSFNETGFKIERKTSRSGIWEEISTIEPNVTSYSDISSTGFAFEKTYYYRVRAYNAYGYSPFPDEIAASVGGIWSLFNAGNYHSLGLKTNGTIWGWGANWAGQLGLGDAIDRNIPTQIGTNTDWFAIIASGNDSGGYTIGLKTNPAGGTIWGWGYGAYGQLGFGDTANRMTPAQIGTDSNWSIAAAGGGDYLGGSFTIGLKKDGTIYSWGGNSYGQLGLGDTIPRNTPSQIGFDTRWVTIAAGSLHTIAQKNNGLLWSWGNNLAGQLGLGNTINRSTPNQIGDQTDWSLFDAGADHTIAIKNNMGLWAWGGNSYGQLGDGTSSLRKTPLQIGTDANWSKISAGNCFTLAVKMNGTIWSWGYNEVGQLGLGDTINRTAPVQIGSNTQWTAIETADFHAIARKANGTLWAWGNNYITQLGLGDTIDRWIPTLVGE